MKRIISKNPLFYAFLLPALVDGIVTIVGQDALYWTSRIVNEASPAYYFLAISPYLFILGSILWFVFWYWVFKKAKEPLNLFLTFIFISGHSWGSTSWIWKVAKDNVWYVKTNQFSVLRIWGLVLLYFGAIAIVASYSLQMYMRKRRK